MDTGYKLILNLNFIYSTGTYFNSTFVFSHCKTSARGVNFVCCVHAVYKICMRSATYPDKCYDALCAGSPYIKYIYSDKRLFVVFAFLGELVYGVI